MVRTISSKTSISIELYAPKSEERKTEILVCEREKQWLKKNIDWKRERETSWILWIYVNARQKPALRTPLALADHVMWFFCCCLGYAKQTHIGEHRARAQFETNVYKVLIYWHFGLERIVNFVCSAISGDNEIVRQEGDETHSFVCVWQNMNA